MIRWAIASLFTVLLLLGLAFRSAALAQTAPPPTGSPAPGSTPTGAFSALSPGNQRIARALFDAQTTGASTGTSSTATPLTLDQIAAKKQGGEGWGRIFQDMKAQGLVQAKNLGQVVSRSHRGSRGLVVTAGGRHERDDDVARGVRESARSHESARPGASTDGRYANVASGAGRTRAYAGGSGRLQGVSGHAGRGGK